MTEVLYRFLGKEVFIQVNGEASIGLQLKDLGDLFEMRCDVG